MFVCLWDLKLYGKDSGILVQVRKNIHSESFFGFLSLFLKVICCILFCQLSLSLKSSIPPTALGTAELWLSIKSSCLQGDGK